jgi:hypothetical protein
VSPVELIDGPFVMRDEHEVGTLVERREIAQTSSRANVGCAGFPHAGRDLNLHPTKSCYHFFGEHDVKCLSAIVCPLSLSYRQWWDRLPLPAQLPSSTLYMPWVL